MKTDQMPRLIRVFTGHTSFCWFFHLQTGLILFLTDVKQLKWEVNRDRWLHGKNDWRSKKGGKSGRKQGHFKNKGRQFGGKGKHKGKGKK